MSNEAELLTDFQVYSTDDKPYVVTLGGVDRPYVVLELAQGQNGADIELRMTFGGADIDLATNMVANAATVLLEDE